LTRARDQSSFSCCAATQGFAAPSTAGDPNVGEWATSGFERRHSFLGTVTYPITAALELTAIGRVTSGAPFTPLVGSDINGDGARNDRALVFDPAAAPDTAVANGMGALLATASPRVRDCLQSQLGRVAARNSCAGPWQPSLDLQINWRRERRRHRALPARRAGAHDDRPRSHARSAAIRLRGRGTPRRGRARPGPGARG